MKNKEPWHHIKDILTDSSKEIMDGFEDIALMIIGKKRKSSKSKK